MQTIPDSYKHTQYDMRLVRRFGNAAMYKAIDHDYWEVYRIRVRSPEEAFGKQYPEREILPGSSCFGRDAWCCVTQERADMRFQGLLADPIAV